MLGIDKGYKDLTKKLKDLQKKTLKIGVFSDAGESALTGKHIAEYAYYYEFGTKNIPTKLFLSATSDEHKGECIQGVLKLADNPKLNTNEIVSTVAMRAVVKYEVEDV